MSEYSSTTRTAQSSKSKKRKKKNLRKKRFQLSLSTILIVLFAILGIVLAYILKVILTSPEITAATVAPQGYTTFIYDDKGEVVDELHTGTSNRVYIEIDEIPEDLQNAIIVMEDKRFYSHNGIDLIGLARAAIIDIATLSKKQGASTLTQQLIKNNVLTSDKKLERKIREMYLATVLESKLRAEYGKEEAKKVILELYLNTVGFGKGCYGVQAASERYFGKDVNELNLDECTVLAAIIQRPRALEPVANPENNNNRRKIILKYLKNADKITNEEYKASVDANPYVCVSEHNEKYVAENETNSYFADTLIEEITKDLVEQKGLTEEVATNLIYSGGLKIYSTMNKKVQDSIDAVFQGKDSTFATQGAEYTLTYNLDIEKEDGTPKYFQKFANLTANDDETVNAKIEELKKELMTDKDKILNESHFLTLQPQASMVILDYRTGEVKGIAGGRGEKNISRGLNRATQSPRQAGSTFKVLAAFAPAIDMKIKTAASVQDDVPYYLTNYGNKEIKNWYSGPDYRGLSTLRDGTRDSMNIVAVKTVMDVGLDNAFDYLTKFGFTTLVESRLVDGKIFSDKSPSVALGGLTDGVTVLELTAAYGTIANGGVHQSPIFYTKVTDINDKVLLTKESVATEVLDPGAAWIVTTMLYDVCHGGTGSSANIGGQYVAGKTGTTTDSKDLTFAGFTGYYAGGIWVGHDQPKVIRGDQSIHTRAWAQVMAKVHEGLAYKDFPRPSNVTSAYICTESGKIATHLCEQDQRGSTVRSEWFLEGTVPSEECDCHVTANVVKVEDKYYLANPSMMDQGTTMVFIKRNPDDKGSYYDPNIKDKIGDSIYEVPTTYYDGSSPTTPIEGGITEGDENPDDVSEPFDDVFKDSREQGSGNDTTPADDNDDFEPIDNSVY